MRSNGHDTSAWRLGRQHVEQWWLLYTLRGADQCWRIASQIARRAKGDGTAVTCTPSHGLLAALTGLNERTVARHVAQLVRLGWLERIGPPPRPGLARTYRLRAPVPLELQSATAQHKGMWRDIAECMTQHVSPISKKRMTRPGRMHDIPGQKA